MTNKRCLSSSVYSDGTSAVMNNTNDSFSAVPSVKHTPAFAVALSSIQGEFRIRTGPLRSRTGCILPTASTTLLQSTCRYKYCSLHLSIIKCYFMPCMHHIFRKTSSLSDITSRTYYLGVYMPHIFLWTSSLSALPLRTRSCPGRAPGGPPPLHRKRLRPGRRNC
jgi:hypothetical protein